MNEADRELRNIKLLSQVGTRPVLGDAALNDDAQERERVVMETIFCGEEQPTTILPSEQQLKTRESFHSLQNDSSLLSQNPAAEDDDDSSNKSAGLEILKQTIKQYVTGSQSMLDPSSGSSYSRSTKSARPGKESVLLSFNDQEQQSPVTSESSLLQPQLQEHVSTPGAFLMRGASVAGQAQKGTITPCHDDVERTLSSDASESFLTAPVLSGVTENSKDNILNAEVVSRNNNKKKKRWCILGTAVVLILIGVLVPTILVRRRKKSSSTNNESSEAPSIEWNDLVSECDIQGHIDLSMIDTTAIMKYQDMKRFFISNDEQVQVEACSPQQLALLSLSLTSDSEEDSTSSGEYSLSRYILSVLFFTLRGHEWSNNFGWLTSTHECGWFGIECSQDNKVITLNLSGNNLIGSFPDEMYQLTSLQKIRLLNNDITGTISSKGIQNLTDLQYYNIFGSPITGPLPSELFALPNLTTFAFSQTSPPMVVPGSNFGMLSALTKLAISGDVWDGSIPTEIGFMTNLKRLFIIGPTSQGHAPVPNELALLPSIEFLHIRDGAITGTIPSVIFEENKNWKYIKISSNFLTGTIPTLIGTQTKLGFLDLETNRLTGTIPTELSNCAFMNSLNLAENQLKGTIPTEIGRMSALETLKLNDNLLTGTLPTEVASLEKLTTCEGCLKP